MFVSKSEVDARTLHQVIGQMTESVICVTNIEEAQEQIRDCDPEIVFCDTDLEGRQSWRELLDEPDTPEYLLIVVSRLANESLWAEVLNLGGFDVLALPFDREELERVTLSAVRRSRHASSSVPLSQFRSVRPISPLLGHGSTLVAGLRRHTAPWAKVLGGADVESNIRGLQEPRAASTTKTGSL